MEEKMALRNSIFKIMISAVTLIFLAIPGILTAGVPQHGGTMVYITPKIPSLSPLHPSWVTGIVLGQIFTTLTRLDANNEVAPNLAKSWTVSDDGLTVTFNLAENARFHDGKPITSEDVAFSIGIMQKNHRFGKQMFGPIEKMDTSDPHTLILHLSQPHGPLLVAVTTPRHLPIMPKHVYGMGDIRKNPANKNPVGSGPFILKEWKLDEYIIFERNKNHFDYVRPYLDRIIGRVVLDKTSVRVGLERNQFHLTGAGGTIRFRDISDFAKIPHLEVVEVKGVAGNGVYLDINNRRAPFNKKKVRQALYYAIDRNYIVDVLHDGRTIASVGPFPVTNIFFDKNLKGYPYDPEKAEKLLDEAGYSRKSNGIRFEMGVAYFAPPIQPDIFLSIGEYIGVALKKVGIKVKQQPLPRAAWLKKMANWDYDTLLPNIGDKVDPAVGIGRLYRCDNIMKRPYVNTTGYCNKKVDELFKRGAREPDHEKRMEIYAEVQKLLVEEAPYVWLFDQIGWRFQHKDLWTPTYGQPQIYDEIYWKKAQK